MTSSHYFALTRDPKGDAPLIFAFHGTGGNEHQFSELVEQIVPGSGLVSPRGDVSEHGALRFFRRTGEGVYDMADLAERSEKMAAFIADHKAANPGRAVYGLGYSNGANILAAVAFKHGDLFDRMALLHPLIPWRPADNAQLSDKRVLITAGRRDPICPLPLTERLIDYFETQGSHIDTSIHDGGHEIRQDELLALQGFLTAP
ncbi:alpha/beta hydrolase [Allorhizobium terrae]|uniref:Alpha/beta hydrolase n=1 Tax=Allorhizobium terrae TaxID=1848972 RepID=A0A4S3ZQX9_9HYPH|nr:alpha/beta hydrolase [Allorhizobium terrae]THF47979.1 alpha/beta hydrolase [Allorhizobium terrae]